VNVAVRVYDRITRVAPLGVRFWDTATDTPVRAGLQVTVYPIDDPRLRVFAAPNPSGVHVLHDAPGLSRSARGAGDKGFWVHPPEARHYRCEVTDPERRFHPVAFEARLPAQGLFAPDCTPLSPPSSARVVYLFSTPTRSVPGSMAVIRTELVSVVTGASAAWAVLSVEHRGVELGRGVADREGKAMVVFPFPEPERRPRLSPPDTPPPEDSGFLMKWSVRLRAFHEPRLAAAVIPDYCALLSQPEALLLEDRSPPLGLEEATVALARESILVSRGGSHLFVAPA
jgi:hypothetical protein